MNMTMDNSIGLNSLYIREYSLAIGIPGQQAKVFTNIKKPNDTQSHEIKFYFEVEKTRKSDPNVAKVQIYNLAEETRNDLEKRGYHVAISAGYIGRSKTLFEGDITKAQSHYQAPDWITDVEVRDGGTAYNYAMIYQTFCGGTSYKTLYKELAAAMQLPIRYIDNSDVDQIMQNGVTYCGLARKYLDALALTTGHDWSIQNGGLQVIKTDGHNNQGIFKIDASHGMVGSPDAVDDDVTYHKGFNSTPLPKYMRPKTIRPILKRASKKKKKRSKTVYGTPYRTKSHAIRVTSLLIPDIIPGCRVELSCNDKNRNGLWLVEKVSHKGDTFDQTWYTELILRC